jgi:hypothetical protein
MDHNQQGTATSYDRFVYIHNILDIHSHRGQLYKFLYQLIQDEIRLNEELFSYFSNFTSFKIEWCEYFYDYLVKVTLIQLHFKLK